MRTRREVAAENGVEGNSRLTAANGTLLTVLLFVEGLTILDVRGLITVHIFVGLLLVGPVLLKLASTGYRFLQYYTRKPAYVRRGPPSPVLRMLGPLVVVSTVAVIGTGALLLTTTPGNAGFLVFAHKASFAVWFLLMTVHVLGHLREAAVGTMHELRPARTDPVARRRAGRLLALALSLAIGVGVATAFVPAGSSWNNTQQWGDH